jgi:hypothetical protein
MRILVSLESDYRAYRDVLAVGIRILRPRSEVEIADAQVLEEEVERFKPVMLICSRPKPVDSGVWPAWVELSVDPTQPTKASVGGRYFERINPALDELLGTIDEVEQLDNRKHASLQTTKGTGRSVNRRRS